jgi:hypothetical protein
VGVFFGRGWQYMTQHIPEGRKRFDSSWAGVLRWHFTGAKGAKVFSQSDTPPNRPLNITGGPNKSPTGPLFEGGYQHVRSHSWSSGLRSSAKSTNPRTFSRFFTQKKNSWIILEYGWNNHLNKFFCIGTFPGPV